MLVDEVLVKVAAGHCPEHVERLLLGQALFEAAAVGRHRCEVLLLVAAARFHVPVLGLEFGMLRLLEEAQEFAQPLAAYSGDADVLRIADWQLCAREVIELFLTMALTAMVSEINAINRDLGR